MNTLSTRPAAQRLATPQTRRLFFALWPDADIVAALGPWARHAHDACGGRIMRPDTLHLTLAFLGSVDAQRIPELAELVRTCPAPGGTVTLNRFGHFRGPRIVWAGPSATLPWLDTLHRTLWQGLARHGFPAPDETFRPHVSLLRKADTTDLGPLPTPCPIVWHARRLVLVASTPRETGSYYEVLAEARLGQKGL
ncbi:RNA 2',3'-cyclic phosphodiesterase [Castellaniella caeni]